MGLAVHREHRQPGGGGDPAVRAARFVAAVGFTFRRSPAINAIRQQITEGVLGPAVHFHGHYWCDYGFDADAPMSWRYRGGPGSGALADIGTHLVDVGEFLCGPVASVRGTVLSTVVPDRPVALGVAVGHAAGVPVSEAREPVGNEDIATFTATFAGGATGTFSVSRVAYGLANALGFEVFCRHGAAAFDLSRRPVRRSSGARWRSWHPSSSARASSWCLNRIRTTSSRTAGPPST